MLRRILPLAIFLVLAVLLAAGIRMNYSGRDISALPSPLIGKAAPVYALPVLGDSTRIVRNTDLRGAPYLLNVWASWCPNCRDEHPLVTQLARRGVVRVIGYDYKDPPEDAQRWLAQFGDPYSLILADSDGRTAIDWGIYAAPETYLVDAAGIVRWKHVGPLTEEIISAELLPRLSAAGPK